jgi:uncharacterized protein
MHPLIGEKRQEIARLCDRYHVRRLALFGSATGNRFDPAQSDVDFAVEFEPLGYAGYSDAYFGLLWDLEALLSRPVDLVTTRSMRNPYFRKRVEETEVPLYAR